MTSSPCVSRQWLLAIGVFLVCAGPSWGWVGQPPQVEYVFYLPHIDQQDPNNPQAPGRILGERWKFPPDEAYRYYADMLDLMAEFPHEVWLSDYQTSLTVADCYIDGGDHFWPDGRNWGISLNVEKWCTCNNPATIPSAPVGGCDYGNSSGYEYYNTPEFIFYYEGPTDIDVGISTEQVRTELQAALGVWKSGLESRVSGQSIPIALSWDNQIEDQFDLHYKVFWASQPGEPLAHSFIYVDLEEGSRIDVDICINEYHPWIVGESESANDLRGVLVHELGHAWGLYHPQDIEGRQFSYDEDVSCMYGPNNFPDAPFKSTYKQRTLCQVDGDAFAWLYGCCRSAASRQCVKLPRRAAQAGF